MHTQANASGAPPIPFHKGYIPPQERAWLTEELERGVSREVFEECAQRLKDLSGADEVLLAPTCTAAIEAVLRVLLELGELNPGEMIAVPNFTYHGTALPAMQLNLSPVVISCESPTLNMDPASLARAFSDRDLKMLMPIYYAGEPCDERIFSLVQERDSILLIDAAQTVGSFHFAQHPECHAGLAVQSFSPMKPFGFGGGAILVKWDQLPERLLRHGTERLRELLGVVLTRGTDIERVYAGKQVRYEFVSRHALTSVLSPMAVVSLVAQLRHHDQILAEREALCRTYDEALADEAANETLILPRYQEKRRHPAQFYWLLFRDPQIMQRVYATLAGWGIRALDHFAPLSQHPASSHCEMIRARKGDDVLWRGLLRLPLYNGMDRASHERVVACVHEAIAAARASSRAA